MSSIAAAVVGGNIISGMMGADSAQSAADTQAAASRDASAAQLKATQESNALQKDMYDQNVKRQEPWVLGGQQAQGRMGDLMGLSGNTTADNYGYLGKQFGNDALALTMDPSYQFRLQQGQQALQSSAAARGGLLTGQGAKDINDYAQGAASTEYGNAYSRYNTDQTNLYNRMNTLSALGQNAAAGVGAQGTQVASNMGNNITAGAAASNNYLTSGAAAQAAGQVGSANAWSNSLGNAGNTLSYLNGKGINPISNAWNSITGTTQAAAPVSTATVTPVDSASWTFA